MDGGIITLPLRAGAGWTRFWLRAGLDVAGCALNIGGKVAAAASGAAGRASDAVTWGRPAATLDVAGRNPLDVADRKPLDVAGRKPGPVRERAPVREPGPVRVRAPVRDRQTVLAAAQRSLKIKTGRGSPD
jgi:hypothetical protein